jgi:hypothetical protein
MNYLTARGSCELMLMISELDGSWRSVQHALNIWHGPFEETKPCPNCNQSNPRQVTRFFREAPPVLTIKINSTNSTGGTTVLREINKTIEVPLAESTCTYVLCHVTIYNGIDHYWCICRTAAQKHFYLFDDTKGFRYEHEKQLPRGSRNQHPCYFFYIRSDIIFTG